MNRREAVQMMGAVVGAVAWRPGAAQLRMDRIGLQLYTVRTEMAKDVDATLARVREIGYTEVEFAGYFNKPPKELRASLDRIGLTAPAAHVELGPDWKKVLDDALVMGHRYVVAPWVAAERRRTLSDWKRVAQEFNKAGDQARAAGLRFLYHNHDFEFVPLEGKLPYDVLLAETDKNLVGLEMDLYWITKGGQDPLAYFNKYPGRFSCVHVKDMDRTPQQGMVDVGAGKIDFKAIFARSKQAGIAHYFVEHDQPAVPFDSIRNSYQHLRALTW